MNDNSITCYVYRSLKKTNTYLYVVEKDEFSHVPESLMNVFGQGEFSLEFEHTPERQLAQEDGAQVYENLNNQGFHLQLPKEDFVYDL